MVVIVNSCQNHWFRESVWNKKIRDYNFVTATRTHNFQQSVKNISLRRTSLHHPMILQRDIIIAQFQLSNNLNCMHNFIHSQYCFLVSIRDVYKIFDNFVLLLYLFHDETNSKNFTTLIFYRFLSKIYTLKQILPVTHVFPFS